MAVVSWALAEPDMDATRRCHFRTSTATARSVMLGSYQQRSHVVTMTLHAGRAEVHARTDLDHPESVGRGTEVAFSSVEDRAAQRRARAESLAAAAGGDRQQLENLRSDYLRRLHRTSDDFDATEGLRTVGLALSMTPRPEGLWAWQRRGRDAKRRWWSRRRRPTG
jgi:hypothetical protein